MPQLLAAIRKEPEPAATCALLFLLTGARRGELLAARWEDLLVEEKLLRLPRTKSGRPQYSALSEYALSLLLRLPPPHSGKIFPWSDFKRPWRRIRARANLPDLRLHDLRRTFASWLAISGHSLYLIGQALHHQQPSTTAIYARLQTDSLQSAVDELADKLSACEFPPLSLH